MPDLKRTRNRLTAVAAALIVVDVVAVVMLMTPVAGSESSRQAQMNQLWLSLKSRESAPWRGLDKKIPQAQTQIADFYRQRFPDTYSAISTNLDKVGSETGVKVSGEKYSEKDAEIEGIQRVEIAAEVSGDYLQLVRFINALERNQLFFMVDDLELGNEQNGNVKLQIKLETYLRTAS
jgi:Type II secretion system (T2SS), protein M subtype b